MHDDDLRLLRHAGAESDLPAGMLLIERGQPGSGLFVILDGRVVVEAPEGRRVLGVGAVVGERALLTVGGARSARVRAATDVRVLAVGRADFDRLSAADAGLPGRIVAAAS